MGHDNYGNGVALDRYGSQVLVPIQRRTGFSLSMSHDVHAQESNHGDTPDPETGKTGTQSCTVQSWFDVPDEMRRFIFERNDAIDVDSLSIDWPDSEDRIF